MSNHKDDFTETSPINGLHKPENKLPLVSIILPAYNHEDFMEDAIKSSLNQSYSRIEIIVVDDKSTDKTPQIIKKLADEYPDTIKYIQRINNGGAPQAWNDALSVVQGEFIVAFASDDLLPVNSIKNRVEYLLEHPEVSVLTTDFDVLLSNGQQVSNQEKLKFVPQFNRFFDPSIQNLYNALLVGNFIPGGTIAISLRNVLKKDLIQDTTSPNLSDYELWLTLAYKYKWAYIPESTWIYRWHGHNLSAPTNPANAPDIVLSQMINILSKQLLRPLSNDQRILALRLINVQTKNLHDILQRNLSISNVQDDTLSEEQDIKTKKLKNKVSIVIVTYNSEKSIRACLESVIKFTPREVEVIVVDNASKDSTREILAEYSNSIEMILNEDNKGFSEGCNQGINLDKNDYIVLLNPDTVVTDGWIEKMLKHFEDNENSGAIGPVSNYVAGLQKVQFYLPKDLPNHLNIQIINKLLKKNKKAVETKLLIGFCMMLSTQALKKVGVLDENLFLGNDDLDMSWKLRLNGYKLFVATDTYIHHDGQVSFKTEKKSKTDLLIIESTEALFKKLQEHYGINNVPTPMELWGINWFTPNNAIYNSDSKIYSTKSNRTVEKVSLIILTYNALEYTKKCVDSIIKNTKYPYEIVFIDNASTDGSVEYLRELVKEHSNFKIIENKENKGFAYGNNQGVKAAIGKYVMLLNNDVLVSQGWLERLVETIEKDEKIGAVGPITNLINGRQMVPAKKISYKKDEDFFPFSQFLLIHNKGRITPRRRLAGFAVLMEKSLYNKVGGLDEDFGIGNFEDDDLSLKIREKGYALMVDDSVYIHHYGSQTFIANNIDYIGNMKTRFSLFHKKWPHIDYEELIELKNPLNEEEKHQLETAVEYIKNEVVDNAKKLLSDITLLNPISEDALYGLALCARQECDNALSLKYLHKILLLNPNHADALNQAGLIAVENGDLLKAQTLFISSIESDRNFVDAQRNLSECLLLQEEFDQGVKMYLSILEKHPKDVPVLLRMAQLNLEAGNASDAKEWAEKVLTIASDNSVAREIVTM